jgi:hypothetical protein
MGTGRSVPMGKATVAWGWPLLYIVPRLRMGGAIPSLTHIPSWRSHGLNLVKEFPSFHGTEISWSCSEEPEAGRNSEGITLRPVTLEFRDPFKHCSYVRWLVTFMCCTMCGLVIALAITEEEGYRSSLHSFILLSITLWQYQRHIFLETLCPNVLNL